MQAPVDIDISDSWTDDLYRKAVEDDIKDYAIFLIDTDSNVINWNRGAERILGYSESEIIGKSGGEIDVSLERNDGHARLRVQDNGVGIDPSVLPHIFERFRQADSSTVRAHSGLGLGLAIVRHLVREHNGSVNAESHGRGQGATFTIDFPLAPSEVTTEGSVSSVDLFASKRKGRKNPIEYVEDPCALDGITVLLVEDETDTRDLLTTILQECGARVIAVGSAKDALASIQSELPNVLLSDIGMSGESGYDLIREIRALPSEKGGAVPAVALTAYAGPSDRRRALVAGFHVHLAKPVEPDELLAVIGSLGRTTAAISQSTPPA